MCRVRGRFLPLDMVTAVLSHLFEYWRDMFQARYWLVSVLAFLSMPLQNDVQKQGREALIISNSAPRLYCVWTADVLNSYHCIVMVRGLHQQHCQGVYPHGLCWGDVTQARMAKGSSNVESRAQQH